MEMRNLGRTGTKVSSLCLGAMTFGEADPTSMMHGIGSDEDTAFAILNRALDRGVNFVDTADVYGQEGLSERVIGKWFIRDMRRDEVVLASKFRFRMSAGPQGTGASRRRVMQCCENSLRRLQTDRIDLYQIHMQDLDTPEDETLRALDDLVRQGKVLYIGCSNYAAYRLVDALWTSKTQSLERYVTLQAQYSLVVRDIEREHVPLCRTHDLGILPWSPLGGGFLSGKYRKNQPPPAGTRLDKWKDRLLAFDTPRNWRILDACDAVAKELGATSAQVALAWVMRKPRVTSVIFGARSLDQLDDNLKAAELVLPDAAMKALDDASALELGYPYEFMGRAQQGRW
jgi:aryl-alcohol dehydrogenase-like predicted oxidoreductase